MMTRRAGTALALGLWLAAGVAAEAAPARSDRRALDKAEQKALTHYGKKDFDGALKATTEALDRVVTGIENDTTAWQAAAFRVRYLRAISLRELGRLAEARAELEPLAAQSAAPDVQSRAEAALAKLLESMVDVQIYCPQGMSFQVYRRGIQTTAERGAPRACAGGEAVVLELQPAEYRIAWQYGYASSTRALRIEPGPAAQVHLVRPPQPPAATSGGGGCVSATGR